MRNHQSRIITIGKQNSTFQEILSLKTNRQKRNGEQTFFVEGVNSINHAKKNDWKFRALIFCSKNNLSKWAQNIIDETNTEKIFDLTPELMKELSDKQESSEIIALIELPDDDLAKITTGTSSFTILVLDRPSNPGNIGTIIRSADGFGINGIIVTGHAADIYDPHVIRASMGAFFSIPVCRIASNDEFTIWLEEIKSLQPNLQVIGTSAKGGKTLSQTCFSKATILIIGNEKNGMSAFYKELCDKVISIPMKGQSTSLNAACAASIFLHELTKN